MVFAGPFGHNRRSPQRGCHDIRAVTQKGKILVVDDDRLVLATLTHGLAAAGYEIIDADNGDDAILLARAHRPDLALLDIRQIVPAVEAAFAQLSKRQAEAANAGHAPSEDALVQTVAMAVGVLMHRY